MDYLFQLDPKGLLHIWAHYSILVPIEQRADQIDRFNDKIFQI